MRSVLWRCGVSLGLAIAVAGLMQDVRASQHTHTGILTPEEVARASAAGLTTREFSGTREYHAVPIDPNAGSQRRELTQAEVDAMREANAQRARLESQISQREEALPGAIAAENAAYADLIQYYEDNSTAYNPRELRDRAMNLFGYESDEEAALKRAVQSAQHRTNSIRTQLRDSRTELEAMGSSNTEINDRVATLQGQRLQARQEATAEINGLIQTLNNQQNQLATTQQARRDAQAQVDLVEEHTDFLNDIYDFTVGIFGQSTPSGTARTNLENATVQERNLDQQIARTRTQIETARQNAMEQDRAYEVEIIKSSPRLLAEDRARRSVEAMEHVRNVATQRAQIEAGETQFNNQLAALDAQIAAERAKTPAPSASQFTGVVDQSQMVTTRAPDSQAVLDLLAERQKITEAHTEWRNSMDSELRRHVQQQEQFFDRNRQDGIGETNSGESRSTIRRVITDINERIGRGELSEAQGGEMIAEITAIDSAAESAAGTSALAIAQGAPSMAEFENTWGSFFSDVASTNADLTWYEFSLRMGAYTKGVTRAGVDAVKDLAMIAKEGLDTQGEAFEAFLEEAFGVRSDFFGSENLATLERIRSGFAKILDPNDPEGARLAQELVQLGENVARQLERRVESTAGSGNVRRALEDTGYVVGTVVGVEEALFRVAAAAPRAVRGVTLWATNALPPSGAVPPAGAIPTPGAGATGDASRAATSGTPTGAGAADNIPPAQRYGDDYPADGTPWGTHMNVNILDPQGQPNIVLLRNDGTRLELPATPMGKGSTTEVYSVPGRSDVVVRISKADPAGQALDNAGHRALRNMDPDGNAFELPRRHSQHRVAAEGHQMDGGIVEVVDRAPTDWRKAREAGEVMTPGRRRAYRRAMEKINENGFVMLDNKPDNYAFRKVGEPDEWKLVILDAGSIVPMKNLDPAAARRLQHALDNPIDEAVAPGVEWENPLDPRQVTGRQIHTEWLAENFDHLIDWDAINDLHPDFQFHTLGEGYSNIDLLMNKRFPMNPSNGVENPGISGPLRPPDPDPNTPLGPGTGGEHPAAPQRDRSLWERAKDRSPDYSGTRRNPVRLPDDEEGGGSGLISAGGFSGIPVVDPIHFEMGPGLPTGGIMTYCPPCIHYVIEYNQLVASGVDTPAVNARLDALLDALEVCEWFYCGDDEDDGAFSSYAELIQVIFILGNNPYDARDPLGEDGGNLGSGSIIDGIEVLPRPGGVFIPIDQFSGPSDPDDCDDPHYHDTRAIVLPVLDCNGGSQSDPAPLVCGYGTVDDVIVIPRSQCAIRN